MTGAGLEPRATIGWDESCDVRIVTIDEFAASTTQSVIVDVANPFGRALEQGIDLNREFEQDVDLGEHLLQRLVGDTMGAIDAALVAGADGVFYRLHGACERHCSPMQYGGLYLERDREI